MADNRFEQVDEVQPDALNLTLARKADGLNGSFHIPVAAMTMKLPKPIDSGDMDAKDAFRAAVKLANQLQLAIVVIDADGVWDKEWGDLYRYEEPADEGEAASA